MKKYLTFIVFVIFLVTIYWYYQKIHNQTGELQHPNTKTVIQVSSIRVKSQPVMLKMMLPGRTSAFRQSQVRPQVNGIIKLRLFKEGAFVEKGQQLYQLDDAQYKTSLKSAQANLNSARAHFKTIQTRYDRVKSLIAKKAISQQDLDDITAQLDQAKAAIGVAEATVDVQKINLDYTRVYAPIAGRIGRSNLTEGALVTANQPQALAVITQLNPMYIDMQISDEKAIWIQQKLNAGTKIKVDLINENLEYPVSGFIEFSEVNVNASTGSVGLRASINNEKSILLPGLFVNAEISLGERNSVLVPQRATSRTPDGNLSVWVIDEKNQVNPRTINVNRSFQNQWVVTDGLTTGEQIVVEGYHRLAPGLTVEVVKWQGEEAREE